MHLGTPRGRWKECTQDSKHKELRQYPLKLIVQTKRKTKKKLPDTVIRLTCYIAYAQLDAASVSTGAMGETIWMGLGAPVGGME